MNPLDLLFNAAGTMTNGIITDVTSCILAMLTISFMLIGFDYLRGLLVESLQEAAGSGGSLLDGAANKYRSWKFNRLPVGPGSFDRNGSDRDGIELSDRRREELEDAFDMNTHVGVYDSNGSDRHGVDLDEDRYDALENAFESGRGKR